VSAAAATPVVFLMPLVSSTRYPLLVAPLDAASGRNGRITRVAPPVSRSVETVAL
jgi:hypothetical protein